jgi:hypothetical protein
MVGTHLREGHPEPIHGAVQLVQGNVFDAVYMEIVLPFFRRPVASRAEEPVYDSEENSPLDGERESRRREQFFQNGRNPEILPEPFEYKGRSQRAGAVGLERSCAVGIESLDRGSVLQEGTGEGIKLAGGYEVVGVAESCDDSLPDRFAFARILDNLQI